MKGDDTGSRESLLAAAILVIAVLATIVGAGLAGGTPGPIVLGTFPGIADDIRLLTDGCNVTVQSIAPPGIDPHSYNLGTRQVVAVKHALLIVSSSHAPFELQIRKIVEGDRLLEITRIQGIRLEKMPNGVVNPHMPIYDPDNYEKYIEALASVLADKMPQCKDVIESNMHEVTARLARLDACRESLRGSKAVLGSPVAQYAVEWLGVETSVILSPGEEAQVTPETLQKAVEVLGEGGIAVVLVGLHGEPIGKRNQWLYEQAVRLGSPVIYVPAPFTPGSTLAKLSYICSQVESGLAVGPGRVP
ncbi:MAG: zinc ABC transporter substrate-binding protein [Desulfurococcales archaeon]|nr:zinc ABC transporter substrate-binding protein [Desulfurococcales archaeon]